jgi:hypothetical protein
MKIDVLTLAVIKCQSCGISHCVDLDIAINVVEELDVSVFRIVQEICAVWGKSGIV